MTTETDADLVEMLRIWFGPDRNLTVCVLREDDDFRDNMRRLLTWANARLAACSVSHADLIARLHKHAEWCADPDELRAAEFEETAEIIALLPDILTALSGGGVAAKRWRHKKRGTFYTEIGRAELQIAANDVVEGSSLVIYRGDNGDLYAREVGEFEDGRFEPVTETREAGRG